MKRTAILASAGAVALGFSLLVCVVPAVAQGGSNAGGGGFIKLDQSKLPPARFTPSPWQIQILDAGPKVSDLRERKQNQTIQLQIDPLGPEQTQTTVIKVGGGPAGAGTVSGGAPGTFTLDASRPPAARFDSNITAGGPRGAANPLPNGTTTNRLMGADANVRGKMSAPTVTVRKGGLLQRTAKPVSASTPMMYHDNNGSATGSAVSQKEVKANVTGILKTNVKRGEYLKPPH